MDQIRIRGARTHNLKNLDLDLPRDALIVITGPSGSGKSSLAFDTLYAEGQRRYVESLSAYARQFLSLMEKPDVDHIEGLSPAIAIEQKTGSRNPRSTVGTITEIHDYLRLLYARVGTPRCPVHGLDLSAMSVTQMIDAILARPPGQRLLLLAPLIDDRKGSQEPLFQRLRAQGYVRVRVDGALHELDDPPRLRPGVRHQIEVVVDRFKVRPELRQRLAESLETALLLSDGLVRIAPLDTAGEAAEQTYSARHACPRCGHALEALEPRLFSFNNPAGACPACDGLGHTLVVDPALVVADPQRSLADGAIRGWDRRNAHYWRLIEALARQYGFDPETRYADLPAAIQQLLLYGSAEPITVDYQYDDGPPQPRRHRFEGVIPNLVRRHQDTESSAVREELGRYFTRRPCPECGGGRLNLAARNVFIAEHNLPRLSALPIAEAQAFFAGLQLPGRRGEIARPIQREIETRLGFLMDVGLDYLSLDRGADSLSGGEGQRIRLASQIGAGLVGVMYVLDEPSIGLHQRDNQRLLATLTRLRDLGNTVIVVEHDEDAIRAADQVIDMGPAAGVHGGALIAQGSPAELAAHPDSLTGAYLSGRRSIPLPPQRVAPGHHWLRLRKARGHNLQGLDLALPLGLLTCVTGVSGSGKSTLINDTLYPAVAARLHGAGQVAAPHEGIEGEAALDKVIAIDQSPIGRTPRSNPATYTGLFGPLRELFAGVPEARARGYGPGRFSFNVKGGRCEACQGEGLVKVEMHFLPDIHVACDQCQGRRYNRETLEILYKGLSIHDVLELTVEDALSLFDAIPALARRLGTLVDVGLGYIRLGQSATTLSGGEAQRVKLARELARRDTGRSLYILDEPTTGLHFHDIAQLLAVLLRLRDHGNTLVVIEHNLDIIKSADWVIDLGPEGGSAGGRLIASGPPETVAAGAGHTARFLRPYLQRHPIAP